MVGEDLADTGADVAGLDQPGYLLGNFYGATAACGYAERVLRDHA